jgi:hypothetical protein
MRDVSDMGDRIIEHGIFEAFLRLKPDFAGESICHWHQPVQDPPDILCITVSGRRVGVELGEWLNEIQIRDTKTSEMFEDSIRRAIGQQPDNECQNIYFAWIHPRPRARVRPSDVPRFRREIFELIRDVNAKWEKEPTWQSPQGCIFQDFEQYATVGKYLQAITFFPRRQYEGWPPNDRVVNRSWPKGCDWLTFPLRGGAYSPDPMLEALGAILAKKIEKYQTKPPQCSMDEFQLLIYYNQALLYNTPVETLEFSFGDAARAAARYIGDNPGIFQRIFLMLAFHSGEKVFELPP